MYNCYKEVQMEEKELVDCLKALSDYNRLKIVKMLKNGELCGCRLLTEFNFTQPTLSHHMKLLCDCGLLNDRKEGKWHHYSINSEKFQKLIDALSEYK